MQAYDTATLRDRLNELAEVFEKKPVGEKGLTVWFGVLREFPTERVCGVLLGWPRSHQKFPTPSEIWKSCNEMSIAEREAKSLQEARDGASKQVFNPGVSGAQASKFIAQMRVILKSPRWTPMQHWQNNLKRFPKGHIGHERALEALRMKQVEQEPRIPGEDDEKQTVNF